MDYKKNSNTITEAERDAFMDRFKKAARARGYTVASLQSALGRTNAYFRNMGFISPKMSVEIKKYIPDLNVEYINEGVGEPFLSHTDVKRAENAVPDTVPLLPISARGGTLTGFSEEVNAYECESVITPIKGVELAITVNGDSMESEYPSGCVAFIKKVNEKAFIEWGKTYVLDTCNGIVIKNLFPSEEEGKIVCRSTNPKYLDYEVRYTDCYGFYKVMMQMSMK